MITVVGGGYVVVVSMLTLFKTSKEISCMFKWISLVQDYLIP